MRKLSTITLFSIILTLLTSSLSYAAPMQGDNSQTVLTPQQITQAIAELKTAGIPHETTYDTKRLKTTFHFNQGISFTFIEPKPAINTFLGGDLNWGNPYILLNKFDMDLIIAGGAALLTAAICRTTLVGAVACRLAEGAIIAATTALTNSYTNPCGNKQMKIYLRSSFWGGPPRFGGCV